MAPSEIRESTRESPAKPPGGVWTLARRSG